MAAQPPGDAAPDLLLGRYRVETILGEGGLGTVLKALDVRLRRYVAIKLIKRSLATDSDVYHGLLERFENEAQASARMGNHPNLVVVYDSASDAGGTRYLILEYVVGGTLQAHLKQEPYALRDALRFTAEIGRGLQAAHDAGIVHRDIKPGNLFIGGDGRAQVGDFGIAQIDDLSGRTGAYSVHHPGTPAYMSPEQASTTGYLRPASDQYSLGLVLFEMLTGQMYRRLSASEVARSLAALPPPVTDVIARLTAERPDGRYPSMATVSEVADALRQSLPAYVDPRAVPRDVPPPAGAGPAPYGEPTLPLTSHRQPTALPPAQSPQPAPPHLPHYGNTPPVNLQPAPATAPPPARFGRRAVLIGIGGLAHAGGGAAVYFRGIGHAPTATATASPVPSPSATTVPTAPPQSQASRAPTPSPTAPPARPTGSSGPAAATTAGAPFPTRSVASLIGHTHYIFSVAWSPDGKMLASGSEDKDVRLWSAAGQALAVLRGHTAAVRELAWSPDSKILASGSNDVTGRLWDATGNTLATLTGFDADITGVAWSPDGTILATSANDGSVRLWNRDGTPRATLIEQGQEATIVVYAPDGKTLASAGYDATVRLWSAAGQSLATLKGHTAPIRTMAWSPDGKVLASGDDGGRARLWGADGRALATLSDHAAGVAVTVVGWSPDGKILATASEDSTVRLWQPDGRALVTLTGHEGPARKMAWSPGGMMLASGGDDGTVRLWSAAGKALATLMDEWGGVTCIAWSPDGKTLASGSYNGTVQLWR